MPAKEEELPVGDLQAVITSINKAHGEGTVYFGNETLEKVIGRVTTGSLSLDWAVGGGWPLNKWNEIIGEESSGKTATAYKTIAANQALDPNYIAVWIAAEDYVYEYAEMCGVDNDRVIVVDTNVMEEAYDAANKFLASQAIDALVIDSLPQLVPSDEDERAMDEMLVGIAARVNNKFFRKSRSAMKRSQLVSERPVLCLVINQWREKIGVMYGDNRTTPGGKGKNFAYFTRTELRRTEWLDEGKGNRVGMTIASRNVKNKTAPPSRKGEVDFYFRDGANVKAGGYDLGKEAASIGQLVGVIDRRGAYFWLPTGEKVKGYAGLTDAMGDDETRSFVTKQVMSALNGEDFVAPPPKEDQAKPGAGEEDRPAQRGKAARRVRKRPLA